MISVQSVRPEIGLFDEPIMPTRLPETAAKKKPRMIMTTAARWRRDEVRVKKK